MKIFEVYQEEPESIFTHNGKKYNLNKLFRLVDKIEDNEVPVDQLVWIFEFDDPYNETTRIENADTTIPILVTWLVEDNRSQLVVLDGLHRLAKAASENKLVIPCKYVTNEILDKCKFKNGY